MGGCQSSQQEAVAEGVSEEPKKAPSFKKQRSSKRNLKKQRSAKPRESQVVRELQIDSIPDIIGDHGKKHRPVITTLQSSPHLGNKLLETTAVKLPEGKKKGAGVHHLKNVFAAPLEDLTSFKAPVFPKGQTEKTFIRDALKKNFVFS